MHEPVDRRLFQLHEQTELERGRDGRIEFLTHARLEIQALQIAHHIA